MYALQAVPTEEIVKQVLKEGLPETVTNQLHTEAQTTLADLVVVDVVSCTNQPAPNVFVHDTTVWENLPDVSKIVDIIVLTFIEARAVVIKLFTSLVLTTSPVPVVSSFVTYGLLELGVPAVPARASFSSCVGSLVS